MLVCALAGKLGNRSYLSRSSCGACPLPSLVLLCALILPPLTRFSRLSEGGALFIQHNGTVLSPDWLVLDRSLSKEAHVTLDTVFPNQWSSEKTAEIVMGLHNLHAAATVAPRLVPESVCMCRLCLLAHVCPHACCPCVRVAVGVERVRDSVQPFRCGASKGLGILCAARVCERRRA